MIEYDKEICIPHAFPCVDYYKHCTHCYAILTTGKCDLDHDTTNGYYITDYTTAFKDSNRKGMHSTKDGV